MTKPTGPTQAEIDAASERMTTPTHQQSDWEYERDKIILARAYLAQRKAESVSAERDARPNEVKILTADGVEIYLGMMVYVLDPDGHHPEIPSDFELLSVFSMSLDSPENPWFGTAVIQVEDFELGNLEVYGDLAEACKAWGCPLPESEGEA